MEKKIEKLNTKYFLKIEKIKIFYTKICCQKILMKFKTKRLLAFAGIGNPDNFFNLLKENKIRYNQEEIKFPDHHKYTEERDEALI